MKADRYDLDTMRQDAADAFQKASTYHAELKEIYRYFAPWRLPTVERAGERGVRSEGQRLGVEDLYDSTGLSAAASFAANMQADWTPHFEPIFKIEAGPLYAGEKTEFNRAAQVGCDVVHGLLGKTRVAVTEMFQDLFAGTGFLLMEPGNKNRDPIRSVAVSPMEMAVALGPWGDIERWFWRRTYLVRHIEEMWPDAQFDIGLKNMLANKAARDTPVEVTQCTYWDAGARPDDVGTYQLRVWTNIDKTILRKGESRTSPWITPRLFCSPGEPFARGFAHLGLPTAKSLNKARELALRAAAFSLLGLWVRRHDGVFNPDTAVMRPGAMWKVAHTSGPLKSIDRLDVPNNFDVSHVVMKDEREMLRRTLLDDEFLDPAESVRSPTEIAGRMRRYDRNRGGNTIRLAQELIVPLAQRSFEIVEQHGLLPTNMRIDQIITQVSITSPAALAAKSAKVERVVSWLQMIIGLFGPQAALLAAEVETLIPEMARWLGVEERLLRTKGGTEELKQMIAQFAAQMVASDMAKAQQAKAQTAPIEAAQPDYINGAM